MQAASWRTLSASAGLACLCWVGAVEAGRSVIVSSVLAVGVFLLGVGGRRLAWKGGRIDVV